MPTDVLRTALHAWTTLALLAVTKRGGFRLPVVLIVYFVQNVSPRFSVFYGSIQFSTPRLVGFSSGFCSLALVEIARELPHGRTPAPPNLTRLGNAWTPWA